MNIRQGTSLAQALGHPLLQPSPPIPSRSQLRATPSSSTQQCPPRGERGAAAPHTLGGGGEPDMQVKEDMPHQVQPHPAFLRPTPGVDPA